MTTNKIYACVLFAFSVLFAVRSIEYWTVPKNLPKDYPITTTGIITNIHYDPKPWLIQTKNEIVYAHKNDAPAFFAPRRNRLYFRNSTENMVEIARGKKDTCLYSEDVNRGVYKWKPCY